MKKTEKRFWASVMAILLVMVLSMSLVSAETLGVVGEIEKLNNEKISSGLQAEMKKSSGESIPVVVWLDDIDMDTVKKETVEALKAENIDCTF